MFHVKHGIVVCEAKGICTDAARAHKRVDTCGFHPLVNHPFPLRVWRRLPTCDRCEIGERQRIFSTVGEHSVLPCRDIFAVPDSVLLHIRATLHRARHNRAAQFVSAL